jgi:hypothetical protein
MRSLLWTTHTNAYWTAAKLTVFTSVSPLCPQCGQHTETEAHALIDFQSVRPFGVNTFILVSGQIDPMLDVGTTLFCPLMCAPIDPISRTISICMWRMDVTCAHICHIHTDPSLSIHSLTTEWHCMVKEIVNAKQRTAIIHDHLICFSPIWRILALYECNNQCIA